MRRDAGPSPRGLVALEAATAAGRGWRVPLHSCRRLGARARARPLPALTGQGGRLAETLSVARKEFDKARGLGSLGRRRASATGVFLLAGRSASEVFSQRARSPTTTAPGLDRFLSTPNPLSKCRLLHRRGEHLRGLQSDTLAGDCQSIRSDTRATCARNAHCAAVYEHACCQAAPKQPVSLCCFVFVLMRAAQFITLQLYRLFRTP